MLSLSPATCIFVTVAPVDMRRSFNGLYAHAQTVFSQDPLSGHLFECLLDCTRLGKAPSSGADHAPVTSRSSWMVR